MVSQWVMGLAQPLEVSIPVKLEGTLVHRIDKDTAPTHIEEQFDAVTGRGPVLTLTPSREIELTLGSTDPESILSRRFGLPLAPIAGRGFGDPRQRVEFFGFNNMGLLAFDAYFANGWLWDSGSQTKMLYLGSSTTPFFRDLDSDSDEFVAPLCTWDFVEDGVVGNGNNRGCSPAQRKGPEGRFVVLMERGDCLFTPKTVNAALAGAAGVILYDSATASYFPASSINTPGAPIPPVFLRRADGLALLKEIRDKGEGQPIVTWRAANLLGGLSGSLAGDQVRLNLVLSEALDYMFFGTVTGQLLKPPQPTTVRQWFLSLSQTSSPVPDCRRKNTGLTQ